MDIEISLPWTPIKALAHLAGVADIRKHLCGVWIDSSADKRIVVATDGTVLGAYITEEPSTDIPPLFIPGHIIKAARSFFVGVTFRKDATGHCMLACAGTHHYWQDEDWKMVDWRRPLPRACTGVAQQFNPTLIGRFEAVRKALGGTAPKNGKPETIGVRVTHNGRESTDPAPGGALVTLRDVPQFVGVMSAARMGQSADPLLGLPTDPPNWTRPRGSSPAPAAAEETCDLA